MRATPIRLALAAVLLALPSLSGCFLPGGTAPNGCDLEPNGSTITARPVQLDFSIISCNDLGASDTDVFRLPHVDGPAGVGLQCNVIAGSGATVQVDFVPDEGTPGTLFPETSCPGDFISAVAGRLGTPYLRVHHPASSDRVQVLASSIPL